MAEVAKGIIDIEINTGSAASQLKSLQAQINAFNLALNKGSKIQGAYAAEYAKELQLAINRTGAFTAEAIRLNTAAATLDKTLSRGRTSLGQFFSAKFNKDSAVAAEVMALAAERARRMQTQFIATSAAANGMQEALAIRPMAQFSSEMAITAQKSQILASMFRQGTTQLINFGKNVQWAGRQLMVGFTVPLTIFGNTAGRTFMELERQLISFKKVYGDIFTTPAELNQNLEAVTNLAKEYTKYGVAVKDTIGLAAQAAAAGRKNADLTDAVAQATRLATLGQMDQNSALETTISLQSAFRLSGQELADTINFLNMVENQTVVSLQDLAAAIPRVAPVVQGLGGDVKDLAVFLAAMQEGGVDAAEGANALKSGLASLINPTKQATQMLSGMGINLQAIIETNKGDLMGTVMAFSQALANLDQFSRQRALEQVFGKFQYAKLGALFDNISRQGSQAQQVIATMGYTTEQLGATAEKELKTIEQSFGVQLTGAVERFKLAIAPVGEIFVKLAIPVVNFLTKIIEKFNGLSDGQKQFIAIATVITGIVIPAGTMLFGLLMNLTGTLLKMSQSFGAFAKGLVTGGPLGAIKALTQSSKYLSLTEIDAAMAAQQLSVASEAVNIALQEQAVSARMAETAIDSLVQTYMALISTQNAAARMQGFTVPGASASAAKNIRTGGSGFRLRRSLGGPIPGTGSQDTIPAMLTPGEFVVNKDATKRSYGLLKAINDGTIQGFNLGGLAALRTIGLSAFNRRGVAAQSSGFVNIISNAGKNISKNIATQKTHFGNRQYISTLDQLQIVKSSGKTTAGNVKIKIAEELIRSGIPVTGLTDDWIHILKSINQASRRNTNTPMTISSAIQSIRQNPSSIAIDKSSAMARVYPNVTSEEFSKNMINGLDTYIRNNGDVTITDDILTSVRNSLYPKMTNSAKVTGIRLPAKSDISDLVGATSVRGKDFENAVNEYFRRNNSPLEIQGKNIYLLDKNGNRTGETNIFAGSTNFNSGGTVPGSGNTDTVPAMLTPGEFVVNKNASKKNMGLLKGINDGTIKGYALGGVVGALGMTAAIGGQFLPNQNVGNIVSTVGSVATMAPMLKPMIQGMSKAALGFTGVGAGLALLGFGIYKLNKSVDKAASAGAEFSKAMYGTAESTREIAKAFGRQTLAQASLIASAQQAGGQVISQEAQQVSGQFLETQAGKNMLQQVSLVQSKGGNASQALTNQLSQAIIAGAITTEEARAIAVDIGAALKDQTIAVDVSANITRLMGPKGENITKNILKIQAEALPKVDLSVLEKEAQDQYDKMNIFQKGWSNFVNGSFTQQYKLQEVTAKNNSLMSAQLNTVEYLNAALKQGSISFAEYTSNIEKSKSETQKALDANAQALGAINQEELIRKAEEQRALKERRRISFGSIGDPKELKAIDKQKDQVRKMLEETGVYSEEAINKIMDDFAKVGDTSWGKILTGEWSASQSDIVLNFKGQTVDGKPVDVDSVMAKLNALKAVKGIELAVDINGLEKSAGGIEKLYDEYTAFEKLSDVEKKAKFETKDAQVVLDKLGASYKDLSNLSDIQKTIFLRYIEQYIQIGQGIGAKRDTRNALTGEARREAQGVVRADEQTQAALLKDMQDQIKVADELAAALGMDQGTGSGGGGSSIFDNLRNRFDLVSKRLDMEAQKYEDVIRLQERQNDLDQRSIEENQKALDQLTKQEDAINKAYDARIAALDGVTRANDRLKQQEQSRISLATALASGDIAGAASAMSDMAATQTANQIEDARAALELQRETDLKNLKVEINGQMLTREEINLRIDAIEENIYQRNLKIRDAQDAIYNLEQERLKNSREREKVETRLFLLEQQKAIIELKRMKVGKGGLSPEQATWLQQYKDSYNQMVGFFNSTYGENLPQVKMYGGKIKKYAMGGMVFRKNDEAPPTLKMAFGSVVPGLGNTDRVPALLTPGEFVIRKSVAQANMPLLEKLNNGISGPSYTVPKSDFGVREASIQQNTGIVYNDTYSINVNVSGTNASPDDIANVVINKLSQFNSGNVRGIRY